MFYFKRGFPFITKNKKSWGQNLKKPSTENLVKDIRRKARRLYSSEQKTLIVMEAIRGETSVAEICRKHGIAQSMFYKWNKEFLEAGLEHPVLSPLELEVKITDEQRIFISESSVYRILKARDSSPRQLIFCCPHPMSSGTKPVLFTSCGKPTLPTLRSWDGVGIT